jgi:hypothetical protein
MVSILKLYALVLFSQCAYYNLYHLLMNRYRYWNILDWNVRGISSQTRWDVLCRKTEESNCTMICLQETEREHFDQAYLRNFCLRKFNHFAYVPQYWQFWCPYYSQWSPRKNNCM